MQEKKFLADPMFPCDKVVWLDIKDIGRGAMGIELNGCSAFTKPMIYVLSPKASADGLEILKRALEVELSKP